jgi:hypothetical protein
MEQQVMQQSSFTPAKMYMWVKSLESKVNNLLREVDVLKNDFINKNTHFKKDLKTFNEDLMELKHEQGKMSQKMDLIIMELKRTAGAEELASLQKYINLWSPLNFVTQRDVVRIMEDNLGEVKKVLKRDIHSRKTTRKKAIRKHRKIKKKKVVKKHKRKVIHHAN